jgi:RHS repeat-associated protein
MVRTLARSGSGYAVSAERIFGAWGEVRNGSGPSDSKGKYCANLGHVQDDESGLIYMRARYYEPGRGRFVSEDSNRHGSNWVNYCGDNPVNAIDQSGKEFNNISYVTILFAGALYGLGILLMAVALVRAMYGGPAQIRDASKLAATGFGMTVLGLAAFGALASHQSAELAIGSAAGSLLAGSAIGGLYFPAMMAILGGASLGGKSMAATAVFAVSLYSLITLAYIASIDFDSD